MWCFSVVFQNIYIYILMLLNCVISKEKIKRHLWFWWGRECRFFNCEVCMTAVDTVLSLKGRSPIQAKVNEISCKWRSMILMGQCVYFHFRGKINRIHQEYSIWDKEISSKGWIFWSGTRGSQTFTLRWDFLIQHGVTHNEVFFP